jgi:peptidoglycan/LPS O-acetylase OafA/YrhL
MSAVLVSSLPLQRYFDFVCVTAVLPAIVYAALFVERVGVTKKVRALLGMISYPAYAGHAPLATLTEKMLQKFVGFSVHDYAPYSGAVFVVALVPLCWELHRYDVKGRLLLNPRRVYRAETATGSAPVFRPET